jgi:hypothetical protein
MVPRLGSVQEDQVLTWGSRHSEFAMSTLELLAITYDPVCPVFQCADFKLGLVRSVIGCSVFVKVVYVKSFPIYLALL